MVSEKGLDLLDAPIARPGARNVPMPYNDKLELATIPSRAAIRQFFRAAESAQGD